MEHASFACTCRDVCNMGAPDRHVFALYREELVAFNPLVHLHSAYLVPNAPAADRGSQYTVTAAANVELVKSLDLSASWDDGFQATKEAWAEKGIGKAHPSEVRVTSAKKLARLEREHSEVDEFRKQVRELAAWGKTDRRLRKRVQDLYNEEREGRDASLSNVHTIGYEQLALPPPGAKASSKRFKGSTDARRKGRRE